MTLKKSMCVHGEKNIPEAATGLGGKSGGSGMPIASCCWNVSGVIISSSSLAKMTFWFSTVFTTTHNWLLLVPSFTL